MRATGRRLRFWREALTDKTALIVGASAGIGLGLAAEYLSRGWRVVATCRDDRGEAALKSLPGAGRLTIERLDVADDAAQQPFVERLEGDFDVAILNAGVFGSPGSLDLSMDDALQVYAVNALGPSRLAWRLRDRITARTGVLVFTSTGMASIDDNGSGGYDAYRASKAAQNMLARNLWHGMKGRGVTVVSIDPGWVKTAMGGPNATIDVETSARGIADQAEAASGRGDHRFTTWSGKSRTW